MFSLDWVFSEFTEICSVDIGNPDFNIQISAGSNGNPDAKRLYDDLLSDYNKLVRPVRNATDAVQGSV